MSEKVVSIRGEKIFAAGEINPEVVKLAEDLLEMAKSGQINALFAVMTHSDETVSSLHEGLVTYRFIGMVASELHLMSTGKD